MDGQYSVHAVKPGAAHTVLVRMTDSMAAATEENPVWNFTEGSSIAAFAGSPGVRSGRQPPQHSL